MDVGSSNLTSASIGSVAFKSVLRKGREKRWDAFQTIFSKYLQRKFGSDLIDQAETRKDLRYRLIVKIEENKKEKAIGIAIFCDKLSIKGYAIVGLQHTFIVKALHFCSFTETLWSELFKTIREINSHAESVLVNVSKTDIQLGQYLESASFKKIECLFADHYYCYSYKIKKEETEKQIEEQTSGKREREKPAHDVHDNSPSKEIKVELDSKK